MAAVSAGILVGVPVAASASTSSYKQGCLVITPTAGITTQTVYGYNTCSRTAGFRVYDLYPGFGKRAEPCVWVAPGKTGGWKWTKGRKFAGTGPC